MLSISLWLSPFSVFSGWVEPLLLVNIQPQLLLSYWSWYQGAAQFVSAALVCLQTGVGAGSLHMPASPNPRQWGFASPLPSLLADTFMISVGDILSGMGAKEQLPITSWLGELTFEVIVALQPQGQNACVLSLLSPCFQVLHVSLARLLTYEKLTVHYKGGGRNGIFTFGQLLHDNCLYASAGSCSHGNWKRSVQLPF